MGLQGYTDNKPTEWRPPPHLDSPQTYRAHENVSGQCSRMRTLSHRFRIVLTPHHPPFLLPWCPTQSQRGSSPLDQPPVLSLGLQEKGNSKKQAWNRKTGPLGAGHWMSELRPRIKGICPSFHSFTEGNDLHILKLPGIVQVLSGCNCIHVQESRGNPRASLGTYQCLRTWMATLGRILLFSSHVALEENGC